MSDNHRLNLVPVEDGSSSWSVGTVDHKDVLSENIGSLYLREDYCDITLIVHKSRLPAHKVILAARSEYFRAMLFGGLRESHAAEIELQEVSSIEGFERLLRYVYTGHMSLTCMEQDMILDVLGLAHQYGFLELEEAISNYLRHTLSIKNVCELFDASRVYSLSGLGKECCSFIDQNAVEVMTHHSFYSLSDSAVKEIISRDSFCAQEIDIFKAVVEWAKRNPDTDHHSILNCVRLPLISQKDLLKTVRPCELMTADVILDAINEQCELRDFDLRYRGFLMAEENVATQRHGAVVVQGELKANLLDGEVHNYDMEKGFTRHHIDDDHNQGILIKLGMQCIVNHMRLLLWDKDMRGYSYYIEVSMDQKVRVSGHWF